MAIGESMSFSQYRDAIKQFDYRQVLKVQDERFSITMTWREPTAFGSPGSPPSGLFSFEGRTAIRCGFINTYDETGGSFRGSTR